MNDTWERAPQAAKLENPSRGRPAGVQRSAAAIAVLVACLVRRAAYRPLRPS
jgi:hypothetical protein